MKPIYENCDHLKEYNNGCDNCFVMDICKKCKDHNQTNDQKESLIRDAISNAWEQLNA